MKKFYSRLFAFTIILLCVFYACRKELIHDNQAATNIASLETWFNTTVLLAPAGGNFNRGGIDTFTQKVLWNKAVHYKINDDQIFEIPLTSKTRKAYVLLAEPGSIERSTLKSLHNYIADRYIVITQHANGDKDYAVMNLVKDSATRSIEQGNVDNHYKKLSKNFSGYVLFYTWQGQFLNGWIYTKGKIVKRINRKSRQRDNVTNLATTAEHRVERGHALEFDEQSCTSTTIYKFCADCTDWYVNGKYVDTQCGDPYICGTGTVETCTGGEGGGGGGGDYTPPPGEPPALAPSSEDVEYQIQHEPFALLFDVPCDSIKQWLSVATYQPPQAIIDKLQSVAVTIPGTGYDQPPITVNDIANVQDINDAYSEVVNMDYFSVKVNTLPVVNGVRLTADQFLHYIRVNIDNFVDNSKAAFTPYIYGNTNDTNLWNSDNPTGAIVSIDIPINNGSVITSYSSNNKWTFTTIHDPYNGEHPVSGNRNFGYTANADGSYTFYTQGVDRLTDIFTTAANAQPFHIPFNDADELWESFQTEIEEFVTHNSGSATVQTPLTYRPDWSTVKAVIDGEAPLSTLSKLCPD